MLLGWEPNGPWPLGGLRNGGIGRLYTMFGFGWITGVTGR